MEIPSRQKLVSIFKRYSISAAYLFGSQANGKPHKRSDFDIAVRFSKKLSLQKLFFLENELVKVFPRPVDLVDLDIAPLPLQFRVFRARTLLYAKNPKEEVLNRAKALSLYHDYKYHYDRFSRFEMKRILTHGLV